MKNQNIRFSLPVLLILMFFFSMGIRAQSTLPTGWEYQTNTSTPHGIIIMLEANPRINDIPIEVGDYIGAFYTDDNGNLACGGADFWLGDENIIFPLFGNDPDTPEKDGFAYYEQIYFKFYSMNNQKSYDIDQISWSSEYVSTDHWCPLGLSAMIDAVSHVDFDAYASATPNPLCVGGELNLEANIFVETTGTYTYTWTSEPGGLFSSVPELIVSPEVNTTYFLEASDGLLTSNHSISVTLQEAPVIEVGENIVTCPVDFVQITAEGQNYFNLEWATQGDGSFENQNSLNPKYYPGEADIANGLARLFCEAMPIASCSVSAVDSLDIIIILTPMICMPEELEFCASGEVMLESEVVNYSSLIWGTDGDGTFADPGAPVTQYFPGLVDLSSGEFSLDLCATAIPPLTDVVCNSIDLMLFKAPTLNAPTSLARCNNVPVNLSSIANNYSEVLWTSTGDGTFNHSNSTSTQYFPGIQDKINGELQVSIHAFGHEVCEAYPAQRDIQLTLEPPPTVDAGPNEVLCQGQNLGLSAQVSDCNAMVWSSSGDGFFTNAYCPNPVYYPGNGDIANGAFSLVLTAYPIYPCTTAATDELDVEIVNTPQVEILSGDNQVFPLGQPVQLEAEAGAYQSLLWESSGDGTFNDPTNLNPFYMPGEVIDASGEPVVLSLTAFAGESCGDDAFDQISISFGMTVSVDAGDDTTVCEGEIDLSAEIQNCTSLLWQTAGDGTFSDAAAEITSYFPGNQDLENGNVQLCLTGYSGETASEPDCIEITIVSNPQLSMGVEQVDASFGEIVPLIPEIANNINSVLWYTTNGGGDFTITGTATATYTPSPQIDYPQGCIDIYMVAEPLAPCLLSSEDEFELCFFGNPLVDAGDDTTVCEGEIDLSAEIQNCTSLLWQTAGDGTFSDAAAEITSYFPGNQDLENGNVQLCLTGYSGETASEPDCIEITIVSNPQLSMGVEQVDASFGEIVPLIPEIASNINSVLWYTTNGGGDFTITGTATATYTPSPQIDYPQGCIDIYMVAEPLAPCLLSSEDEFELCFFGNPLVDAGDDTTVCEGEIDLSAEIQNCTSLLWQTTGDGTFSDAAAEITSYFPGNQDLENGNVQLCLTGYSGETASEPDCIEITIVSNPQLSMGVEQVDACYNETVSLVPAIATNVSSVLWYTTNGGGDFTPTGVSSVSYMPAPQVDYPQGCIEIYLVAEPLAPCLISSEDMFELCFFGNPIVDAGNDRSIAEGESCPLDPEVSDPGVIAWTTSGDGTFDDPSSLNSVYYPGTDDISIGQVDINLLVYPIAPCTIMASDQLQLTIYRMQTLILPEGWSGISTYLQTNSSIVDVFAPVNEFLVLAQTNTGIYWPEGGLNTIGTFSNRTGYKLRMNADTELILTGSFEENQTIDLTQGWNLMPVLSEYPVYYYDLLDQMGDHLVVAKEVGGNGVIWPAYNIYSLQLLQPGKAYLVAVDQNLSFSFEDIGGEKSGETVNNPQGIAPWTLTEKTSISHTVAIASGALACANTGDFVGAFDQAGQCVGFSEIMDNNQDLAITVFGDEMLSVENEGMTSGEIMQFKLFGQKEQSHYELEVKYDNALNNSDGCFTENGLSRIVEMHVKSTSISEANAVVFSIYPNPARGLVNFESDNESASCHLSIHTINGLLMMEKEFSTNLQLNLSAWPRGIYMVRMQSDKGSSFHKLIFE